MAQLLDQGVVVADDWVTVDLEAPLPDGPAIISLERWRRDRATLSGRNGPLGLRLKSQELAGEIADDLGRFALVVLEFPKFRDGRAFSTARELRERYRYQGPIRAVGHLIPDQYQFLVRAGFTQVEVPEGANLEPWRHALTEITVAYQAAVVGDAPLSWLRRRIGAAPEPAGTSLG